MPALAAAALLGAAAPPLHAVDYLAAPRTGPETVRFQRLALAPHASHACRVRLGGR